MTAVQEKKEKLLKRFREYVRSIRLKKWLTGAELARRCFMDKQNIYRLEKGLFNPSLYYLKKVYEGLEIDLYELIKGVK